jgi:hypothetical protein
MRNWLNNRDFWVIAMGVVAIFNIILNRYLSRKKGRKEGYKEGDENGYRRGVNEGRILERQERKERMLRLMTIEVPSLVPKDAPAKRRDLDE